MAMRLKGFRGTLTLAVLLGAAALVLWTQSTTPTAAFTTVSLQDPSSEVQLLESGDLSFTGVNCNIVCITQQGECAVVGNQHRCSTPESNCCCKYCQGQWGCYPSAVCLGPAP